MKKIISVLLAAAVIVSACSFCAGSETYYDGYPIVLVPGYASASLVYDEDGETHAAWGWEVGDILPTMINSSGKMLRGVMAYNDIHDDTLIIEAIAECLLNLLDAMRCNPDGTSVKNVRPVLVSAEETCDKYMNEKYPDGDYRVELDMTKALDELVGEENVFYFNCDFRMGAVACAEDLNNYIEDVKAYTGKDKVNIVAVSHGGLITATYLSLFLEKGDLYNVVMDEPALAGAGIASDLIGGFCDFDEEEMINYLEYHSMCETDFNWLVRAHQMGFLDDALKRIVPIAKDGVLYWTSLWDFMSPDVYDELKEKNLDPVKSAQLIKNSDYVHYEVMANYKKIFADAKASGVRVNIIAGCGNRILSGQNSNSDGIITVKSSTGAYCAPFGQRFSDSYIKNALDSGRKISPSMDIDITDGYLPDNTWLVSGLFHGMEFWDMYSRNLLFKLLLTDTPIDVHTYKEYPQFRDTSSPTQDVFMSFDKSDAGFVSDKDGSLIITNCSESRDAYILSVKASGSELDFDISNVYIIPAGESANVPVSGKLPYGINLTQISVSYIMSGSLTPLCRRSQVFTALNGNISADGGEDEFVPVRFNTSFDENSDVFLGKTAEKLGLRELINIIVDSDTGRLFKYFIYK